MGREGSVKDYRDEDLRYLGEEEQVPSQLAIFILALVVLCASWLSYCVAAAYA